MSETESRVGKLKKLDVDVNKFIEEFIGDVEIPNYYDTKMEYFRDEYYEKFIIHGGVLYEVIEDTSFDAEIDIFEATEKDGIISYTLQYYNGGCSYDEAIGYALDKLNKKD